MGASEKADAAYHPSKPPRPDVSDVFVKRIEGGGPGMGLTIVLIVMATIVLSIYL